MKSAQRFIRMDFEYDVCESGTIKIHFMTILDIHGNLPQGRYKKGPHICLVSYPKWMFNSTFNTFTYVQDQHKQNT